MHCGSISHNRSACIHELDIMEDILFSWMETCDEFDNHFSYWKRGRR